MMKQLLFALIFIGLAPQIQAQTTYFVDKDATGADDGSSWAGAFTDLQAAIDLAISGDSVFVRLGVYELTASISMKDSVKIYGGFAGTESSLSERVLGDTLSELVRPSSASSDFRIVNNSFSSANPMSTEAVLDGFLITGGRATFGGGIYNVNASPTLSNLIVRENTSTLFGGGVYNGNSSAILTNVVISGNSAIATVAYGGGMYCGSGSPVLTNVIISGNVCIGSSRGYGAGILNNSGTPILTNVIISGNRSIGGTTGYGGGICNLAGTSPTIIRNTIVLANQADTGAGIYSVDPGVSFLAGYSLVQDIVADTAAHNLDGNNITASEIFVNPVIADTAATTEGDYRLLSGSPVIDMGNDAYFSADSTPDLSAITTDLAGNARFNGTIDLGAFEYEDAPLPLLLLSFNGRVTPGGNELLWQTAEEKDMYGFEIERAGKDQVFSKIGFVTASGQGDYRFMDEAAEAGANYYRLRMRDLDGSFSFSEIIYLNTADGMREPMVYPNPFKNLLRLRYAAGDLSLTNMLGQVVYRRQVESDDAALIDLPDLPQGIYLLRLLQADGTVTLRKLVKK